MFPAKHYVSKSAAITGGYTIEMFIPWSNLGGSGTVGRVMGFDIGNNDDDNGGNTREHQTMWWGTVNNSTDTSAFGDIVLSATTFGSGGDTTPPTVSITAPAGGATVSGTAVTLSASASDNVGVVGVQFKVDGANVGSEDTTSPYSISWNSTTVGNGSRQITAAARDAAGNTTTSSAVTVTVSNGTTVGASMPWTYYEAEAGTRSAGATLQTGTSWGQVPFEARGKKIVLLDASGDYVQWTNVVAANRLTIRYSLPDGASGSLGVYLNGSGTAAATLSLSSAKMREAKSESPSGQVRYYDDKLVTVSIAAGSTVKLQWLSGSVSLDFMELETAPGALTKPDSTWVEVSGTTGAAIQTAINTANGGSKKVWIPAGTYNVSSQISDLPAGIQIRGAGMWHTVINKNWGGLNAHVFRVAGANNVMQDFKVVDSISSLSGNKGNNIFSANDSTNFLIKNVWTEYASLVAGYRSSFLTVRDCRVRNGYKDAIHVAASGNNALIENCTFRNTGDDCAAFVSYGDTNLRLNEATYNTIECSYWGRGISFQGGDDQTAEFNMVNDCARAGILVAIDGWGDPFVYWPHNTDFVVANNTIVRCGNQVNAAYGASVAIWGRGDKVMRGRMENNTILQPPFHGAQLTGYLGDAGTSNIVYFRYNSIEAPVAGGTWVRK